MHCRIFSGIPGLYPLDAGSTPNHSKEMSLEIHKSFLEGKVTLVKTTKQESLGMGQPASCRRGDLCCYLPLPFSCGGHEDLSPGGFIMLILTEQCDCIGPYDCLETS